MAKNIADQLNKWDQMIRMGKALQVRKELKQLNLKKIPREYIVEYAQIARRTGLADIIVRMLSSIVHSEKKLEKPASEMEKALLARGLVVLGAFEEASQILDEIKNPTNPQVFFFKASLYIDQWQYDKAVIPLRKSLRASKDVYFKQVLELNLAMCLVAINHKTKATQLIEKLIHKFKNQNNLLLLGNILEIYSQLLIQNGNLEEAIKLLNESKTLLIEADDRSLYFVKKWETLAKVKSRVLDKIKLIELKNEALQRNQFEVVRDLDLQLALTEQDENLLLKVFWGSRFKAYRERVKNQAAKRDIFKKYFIWDEECYSDQLAGERLKINLNNQNNNQKMILDLVELAPTENIKKLIFILLQEYYSPLKLTEIIDFIYKGEYYNPISSPKKLHQLIKRTRQWLKKIDKNIQIHSVGRTQVKLIRPLSVKLIIHDQIQLKKIPKIPKELLEQIYFTSLDWSQLKGVSIRTAEREILKLIQNKGIKKLSKGRFKTNY